MGAIRKVCYGLLQVFMGAYTQNPKRATWNRGTWVGKLRLVHHQAVLQLAAKDL